MIKINDTDPSIAIIKNFLLKASHLKYYYIVLLVLFITTAILYIKYSHKAYKVSASIGPVQNTSSTLLSSNELFRSIGSLQRDKNIEDVINNLKSFSLVNSTVIKMNLEVGYFIEKNNIFKQTSELYKDLPFSVNIDKSHVQPIGLRFYITILSDSSYWLTASQDKVALYNYVDNLIVGKNITLKIDTICKFNETINTKYLRFSISANKEYNQFRQDADCFYFFNFNHLDYLSRIYLESLTVKRASQLASVINIQFQGENKEKAISFLNNFLDSYLEENLAKKNKISLNTIDFIDSQISEISDSLVLSESKLRNYRSANQVMDLSFQGKSIYDQMTQLDKERANLQVQERYYNYIINYIKTNNDISGIAPPSSMNVADPIMNPLITDLLDLNSQRLNILSSKSDKNLFLGQLENKIKIQKQVILESATNNLNTLSLTINELNYRTEKLSKEISQLPKTELNMVSVQRKFNLNDAIYTYLLQKRSEAAITLASNYPDFEILERARDIQAIQVAPKRKTSFAIAIFLALLIPTLYIIGKDLFNNTITSYHDIEHFLNRSIFGVIYSNKMKTESVVADYPGTSVSESFRNLRSNLFLKHKSEQPKVILVTSSQPGDGKSFVSFNLAASIASVGYKTVIIDCDLRLPTLHKKFKEDNSKGITTYMINNTSVPEILCKTPIRNLSFIPSGPIMPNPSERIESGVLDELISSLKKEFEYIIIDTTPIGLVADASLLVKYASQILLILRNNYTRKDIFTNVVDIFTSKQIAFEVVFNDFSLDKSPYKSYSNYYVKK